MSNLAKNILVMLVVAGAVLLVFNLLGSNANKQEIIQANYSQVYDMAEAGDISALHLQKQQDGTYTVTVMAKNSKYQAVVASDGLADELAQLVRENDGSVSTEGPPGQFPWSILFFLGFLILIIWMVRKMQGAAGGGGAGAMGFGKSKAKLQTSDVRFDDVAGQDEAKEDAVELVEYLKHPNGLFEVLDAKVQRGVLMVGPPGTGKTLLAKAIAGEAGVPFFSISGSDFVEMYVGVGASRVRSMFEQARKQAPCIIFIDEIDAVGRKRGAGLGGGHDEREQTLNQLLVELDGFESDERVIVIAATNRPDVLDPALQRRLSRQLVLDLPHLRARHHILKVHLRSKPLGYDVDLHKLAKSTTGMSGDQLAKAANEAALFAAREGCETISMQNFEDAIDKVQMGAERKSMRLTPKVREGTAYHEAGHALAGHIAKGGRDLRKATIVPRGQALGMVQWRLSEDQMMSMTYQEILAFLAMAYGGRSAEKKLYGEAGITTGASNDIQQATNIIRDMITKWGYDPELGPARYASEQQDVFLGGGMGQGPSHSPDTQRIIDLKIAAFTKAAHQMVDEWLDNYDKAHTALAEALLEHETLTDEQIDAICEANGATKHTEDPMDLIVRAEKIYNKLKDA